MNTQHRTLYYIKHLLAAWLAAAAFPGTLIAQNIIINEVHPAPVAGEPEWVELFNRENRTRILRGGSISDLRTAVALPDLRIPARGYLLLTRDTLALKESRSLPATAVLVEIKLPSLNNSQDEVVLRAADSSIVDSLYYNVQWGRRGISLERIDAAQPALSAQNLAPSLARDSASAGYVNSVVLLDRDARPLDIRVNRDDSLGLRIGNNGRLPLEGLVAALYADVDADGHPSAGELLAERHYAILDSGAIAGLFAPAADLDFGFTPCIAVTRLAGDERPHNDTLRSRVFRSYREPVLRINEFMFRPLADSAEYIELWNAGSDTLSPDRWIVHDQATASGADTIRLAAPGVRLPPGAHCVITWDSAFYRQFPALRDSALALYQDVRFNLNADEDEIVLRDPNGLLVDSLRYRDDWHILSISASIGRSLEKINPRLESQRADSWTTSGAARGGTPAAANSVSQELPAEGSLEARPNPFSATGSAGSEICFISYSLPFTQASISVNIFDPSGVPLRSIARSEFTASQGRFAWNGTDDDGHLLPVGAYVCLIEATDFLSRAVFTEKLLIVIKP